MTKNNNILMFFELVQQNDERNEFRMKNHACIILYFKYGNIKKYKCLGSLGKKPKVGFFLIEQAFFGKFCPGPIKRPAWNIFEKLINVLSLIRASWVEQMLKINKIVQPYYSELQSIRVKKLGKMKIMISYKNLKKIQIKPVGHNFI